MHLVQIILPLSTNDGRKLPRSLFDAVQQELVDAFGGVTAYARSPAKGLWDDGAAVQQDEVILYEVMAETLDRPWWARYRQALEARFEQQEVLIRAQAVDKL